MGECLSKELAPPAAAGVDGNANARGNAKRLDAFSSSSFLTDATDTDKTLDMDRSETLSDSTTGSGSGEVAELPSSPDWPGACGPSPAPGECREECRKEGGREDGPEECREEGPAATESPQEQDVLGELPPSRPRARPGRRRWNDPPRSLSLRDEAMPRSTFGPPSFRDRAASAPASLAGSKEDEVESRVRATARSLQFQGEVVQTMVPPLRGGTAFLFVVSKRVHSSNNAHILCTPLPTDAEGRGVSYRLRPSKKKSCATFLELTAEGEASRKVRSIVHDPVRHTLADKRSTVSVPPDDAADVLKGLRLLCKISMVRLESADGVALIPRPSSTNSLNSLDQAQRSPRAMRRVRSNADFRSNAGLGGRASRRPPSSARYMGRAAGGLARSSPPIIGRR